MGAPLKLVLVQPTLSYTTDADNAGAVWELLAPLSGTLDPDDIVLLPEHWDLRLAREEYEADVVRFATELRCHVVGGSHHEASSDGHVNSGIAVDGTGTIIGAYDKLRPYADERTRISDG